MRVRLLSRTQAKQPPAIASGPSTPARDASPRHHGGASLVETDELAREYDFIARDERQSTEKFAIARTIADMVQPGMTIILDGGTTAYAVARLLVAKRLQVVTNSLPIAGLFSEIGSLETIVTGGSRGIGRCIAIAFAREGADVLVNYNTNDAAANEVVSEVEKLGRNGIAVDADVADFGSAKHLETLTMKVRLEPILFLKF